MLLAAAHTVSPRFSVIQSQWQRNIPVVVVVDSKGEKIPAIIDTGGVTESRASNPRDFYTYYSGLPVELAVGGDYLKDHRLMLGSFSPAGALTLKVDVRSHQSLVNAFVSCRIGAVEYYMLFDTAALAWRIADRTHSRPSGVIFLRKPAFQRLLRSNPTWPLEMSSFQIVNERGHFVTAPSVVAPRVVCGPVVRQARVIVERDDDTTYALLRRVFGVEVDGDVGLAALSGPGLQIDYPNRELRIGAYIGGPTV